MEKRKLWLWILGGFPVLVLGGLAAARIAAGVIVESDSFRTVANEVLEAGARSLLPNAMTEIGPIRIEGLANLELSNVTVRDRKHLMPVLEVDRMRLTPHLLSLLGGVLEFDADALLSGGGRVAVRGGMVNGAFGFGHGAGGPRQVKIDGTLTEVNLVTPVALFLAEHAGPDAALTRGVISGNFAFEKPFGDPSERGKKAGRLTGRLDGSTFVVGKGDKTRTLEVPPFDLDLQLQDFSLRILKPIAFTEKTGRATISGGLELPVRADRQPQWDLDVLIDGDQGLATSLARILRCRSPERSQGFKVTGAVTGPDCPNSGG